MTLTKLLFYIKNQDGCDFINDFVVKMASFKPLLIIVAFTVVFVASTPTFHTQFEPYQVSHQRVYDDVSTEETVDDAYLQRRQLMRTTSVQQNTETPVDTMNEMERIMKVNAFPRERKLIMSLEEEYDPEEDSSNRIYKNVQN